jgi:hypothetical protein
MSLDSSEANKNNALKKEEALFFEYFHSLLTANTTNTLTMNTDKE